MTEKSTKSENLVVQATLRELAEYCQKQYSLWLRPDLTPYWQYSPQYTIYDRKIVDGVEFLEANDIDDFPKNMDSPQWAKILTLEIPLHEFDVHIVADRELSIICPVCGEPDCPIGTPAAGNTNVCGGCGSSYTIRTAEVRSFPFTCNLINGLLATNQSIWYSENEDDIYFSETAKNPADSHIINIYDVYRDARIHDGTPPNEHYEFSYWLIGTW